MADEKDRIIEDLRGKLENTTLELNRIKQFLAEKGLDWNKEYQDEETYQNSDHHHHTSIPKKLKLTNMDIMRYSRQLILPEIGVQGQLKLCNTSVLIVGAGGLGCPSALYLAAAGIGHIGLVDYDEVEINNLHRQMLHSELKVHWSKVASAKESLLKLNSSVQVLPYKLHLDSSNALELIEKYDIIVDATDNVPSRYLLNDACVLAGKPLVSGSALRLDGQLTVYNYDNGPCYRCLYPKPPPPETVGNCSEAGVLGVVPGIIGSLQALEVIKITVGLPVSFCQKLLLFDALESRFTTIKLRGRQKCCAVCGDQRSISQLQDYVQFCGAPASDKASNVNILKQKDRISVQDYKKLLDNDVSHILVDVRPEVELQICRLSSRKNLLNVPIRTLENSKNAAKIQERIEEMVNMFNEDKTMPVLAVCHNGNNSQKAVLILREILKDYNVCVKDIMGGLKQWNIVIDPTFPEY